MAGSKNKNTYTGTEICRKEIETEFSRLSICSMHRKETFLIINEASGKLPTCEATVLWFILTQFCF